MAWVFLIVLLMGLSFCGRQEKLADDAVKMEELKLDESLVHAPFQLTDDGEVITVQKILSPQIYTREGEIGVYGFSTEKESRLIYRFDGRNFTQTGTKELLVGQGPGEVGNAANIFGFKDRIFVADHTQRRISVYDPDFKFTHFKALEASSPKVIDNGRGILALVPHAPLEKGKFRAIYAFCRVTFPELEKTILHKYKTLNFEKDSKGRSIIAGDDKFTYFFQYDHIFLVNLSKYTILKFNAAGKQVKGIRVVVPLRKASEEEKRQWMHELTPNPRYRRIWTFPDYVDPCANAIPLKKGFVVTRRKDYSMFCHGPLRGDYYDYDLRYLGRVRMPCFYRATAFHTQLFLSYAFDDGILYTLHEKDEDNIVYAVRRWRIRE